CCGGDDGGAIGDGGGVGATWDVEGSSYGGGGGVESIDCLPNEEILTELAMMGTTWNEFSSSMASAVTCLATGRKFNFSKYIFDSLVRNVDNSSKFYMYPRFLQLIIPVVKRSGDVTRIQALVDKKRIVITEEVVHEILQLDDAEGIETPLFENMLVVRAVDAEE
nr:glutamic acid-rich protein-like [Tanacetum cinerariifolium]